MRFDRPPNVFPVPIIRRFYKHKDTIEVICRVEVREGGDSFIYSSAAAAFFFFLEDCSLPNAEDGVLVWWTMNRV